MAGPPNSAAPRARWRGGRRRLDGRSIRTSRIPLEGGRLDERRGDADALGGEPLPRLGERRHDAGEGHGIQLVEAVPVEGEERGEHGGHLVRGGVGSRMARHERANRSSSKRPMVTFVLPMSAASSFTGRILAADLPPSGAPKAGARLAHDPSA